MNSTEKLKSDIEAFCEAHNMSGSRFSELAIGDPTFWFKLSRGRIPKLDTYDKVQSFIASYKAAA